MDRLKGWMVSDVATFMEQDEEEAQLLINNSWAMNDQAWRRFNPLTRESRAAFYRLNKTYLYELARWNSEDWRWMWTHRIAKYCATQGVNSVVDIGGGIGTDILGVLLRRKDAQGTLVEPNELCAAFARWRADKYGVGKRLTIVDPDHVGAYVPVDLTICMDVLEHMDDPIEVFEPAAEMSKHLAVNFCGNFKDKDFPMHLPVNAGPRQEYFKILRGLDPAYANPDEVYLGYGMRR